MRMDKKGVSLIAVLLFMLIATIAATATYKLLNSVGQSSSSRMQLSEARQSALAGLEAARSWIANNANDAGAVVKTFEDNGNLPVKLNTLLKDMDNASRQYDVYLVGIEKVNQSYRMKLLAEGKSSNNTTYSEVSIIKVNGLYQVQKPSTPSSPAFEHAFFGSSSNPHNMYLTSSIINGDLSLGSATGAHVEGNLFVTGNLSILKNSKVTGNVTVKGTTIACEGFVVGKNLRVEEKFYPSLKDSVYGDLYTDKGISFAASDAAKCVTYPAKPLYVRGNWSDSGDVNLVFRDDSVRFIVDGNAVVNGNFIVTPYYNVWTNSIGTAQTFASTVSMHLNKNVFVNGGFTSGIYPNVSKSSNLSFGSDNTNKVYINSNFNRISDKEKNLSTGYQTVWNTTDFSYSSGIFYSPNIYNNSLKVGIEVPKNTFCNGSQCIPTYDENAYAMYSDYKKDIYYQVNGTAVTIKPDTTGWGASSYEVETTDTPEGNCTGTHVQDMLQFNKAILSDKKIVHSKANGNNCTGLEESMNGAWGVLNSCYENTPEDELYQGKWLVVRVNSPTWWASSDTLKHNIIIVVDASLDNGGLYLPPTKDNNVVLYFPNGFGTIQLEGASSATYNYFIYSEGNISTVRLKDGRTITGSLFMSKCATVGGTDDWNIEYNESMMNSLSADNLFCDYDGSYDCSSTNTGVSSTSTSAAGALDPYYIATAPQLSVVLESQYRNNEISIKKLGYVEPEPSVIVLPRVVYLAQDAYGKLSDYYTAIGLNGAAKDLDQNQMTCPSEIPTGSSQLHGESDSLKAGLYTCLYGYVQGGKKQEIPLYVVVKGTLGESPEVSLEETNKEIESDGSVMVRLNEITADQTITVTITGPSTSNLASGWSYEVQDGVTKVSDDGITAVYKTTFTPSGSKKDLFNVKTAAHAAQGNAIFYLTDPCENCIIGDPATERVFMSGYVTVTRDSSLTSYCSDADNAAAFQDEFGESCSDVAKRPTCEGISDWTKNWSNWVTAISGCSYEVKNEKWMCDASDPVHLQSLITNHDICEAYIPSVELTEFDLGTTYTLPGALKRKTSSLTIKLVGNEGSGKVVAYYHRKGVHDTGVFEKLTECSDNSDCAPMANVYAGDIIKLTIDNGTDKFSYWTCTGDNCNEAQQGITVASREYQISVSGTNTIEAYFNKRDAHCIYTDFSETESYCSASTIGDDCIDRCAGDIYNCAVTEGYYPNSKWIQIYANGKNVANKLVKYYPPTVKSGKIYAEHILTSGTTVVLGRIESGYNGTMTSLFEVPTVVSSGWSQILNNPINDGFIIRANANASSYLALSVISKANTDPFGYWTYARLCYVEGPETKNTDAANNSMCVDAPFAGTLLGTEPVLVTKLTNASITITAKDNLITANLNYNFGGSEFGSSYAAIDLDTTSFKNKIADDGTHNYVGFKLAKPGFLKSIFNSQFKIYDIAWRTADTEYEKSCWDTPTVYCSFEANFVGGMVPDSVNVSPWVSTSSWFADKGGDCTFSYYYNGCDVPASYFTSNKSILSFFAGSDACKTGHGYYNRSAKELDLIKVGVLNSDIYNFTEEGNHGVAYGSGYENDASVMVTCVNSDGDGHRYDARCGEFFVGEIERCSESYSELLESPYNGSSSVDQTIPLKDGPINVRESEIHFTVSDLADGASMSAKLLDEDGDSSEVAYTITKNGAVSFKVEDEVSKAAGFNPQKVSALKFSRSDVTSSYTISDVYATCPYALTMSCNDLQYDPSTEKWEISADVTQPGQAYGCKVTALGDAFALGGLDIPDESISCANFKMNLKQQGVYGYEVDKGFYFRVEAVKQNGEVLESCETPKYEIPEVSVTCSVSAETVDRGANIPSFSFEFTGCPDDGCPYIITEPDGTKTSTVKGAKAEGHCPKDGCKSLNTTLNPLAVGSGYYYEVSSYGKSCKASFDVNESSVNCTSAKIEDGVFKATVDNNNWVGTLVITDYIGGGNPTVESVSGGYAFEYTLPSLAAGSYVGLKLSGKSCSGTVPASGSSLSLNCPASGTISDGAYTFTPAISGCESGCSWTTSQGSISYSDGSVTLSGITTSGDTKISVTKGDETQSCTVNLTETSTSTSECHCTCSSGCDAVVKTGWNSYTMGDPGTEKCFFTVGDYTNEYNKPFIGAWNTTTININGTDYTGTKVSIYNGGSASGNKLDGGFYIQVKSWEYGYIFFMGGTPNCSETVTPEQTPLTLSCPTFGNQDQDSVLQFTPTVTGCDDGCGYSLYMGDSYVNNGYFDSGDDISFIGASEAGEKTYTLSVTRSDDTTTCDFTVTYNAKEEVVSSSSGGDDIPSDVVKITFTYDGPGIDLVEGKEYYIVDCTGNQWGHTIACTADGVEGYELWVNGEKSKYTSYSWQHMDNYQSAGEGVCYSGNRLKVKNGPLRCKFMW